MKDLLPDGFNLQQLPRLARVACAARCAGELRPIYAEATSPGQRRALDRAVYETEQVARGARNVRRAKLASNAASRAYSGVIDRGVADHEGQQTEGDGSGPRSKASECSLGAMLSVCYAIDSAISHDGSAAEAAVARSVKALQLWHQANAGSRILNRLSIDLDALLRDAEQEGWTDDTPVPITFFSLDREGDRGWADATHEHAHSRFRRIWRMVRIWDVLVVLIVVLAILWVRAYNQRTAVERIRNHGGSVMYDYSLFKPYGSYMGPSVDLSRQPPAPPYLQRIFGDDFLANVVSATMRGNNMANDAAYLRAFPKLDSLEIEDYEMSDEAGKRICSELRRLPSLQFLFLHSSVSVSNDTLEHLEEELYYVRITRKRG